MTCDLEQKLRAHCHDLGRTFIELISPDVYSYDKFGSTDLRDYVPEKLKGST